MKKYFAKYLPVEGEIKEGDLHLNKLTGTIEAASKNVATNWNNNLSYNDESRFLRDDYKKVELFICSRDIQVSDEIYLPKINEYHKFLFVKDNEIHCQTLNGQNDEILEIQDYFKKIGKISPEATWVKEGDEFEFLKDCWISNSEIGHLDTFKIKCPTCKNFH